MHFLTHVRHGRRVVRLLVAGFCLLGSGLLLAQDVVTTYQDRNGWKLQVNGEDFFIKGVVWGYIPPGDNYKYNLWGLPEADIKNVLDHEFGLMQQAGINAIRSFTMIPPRWVTYIFDTYGIRTAINPLMGRYGATVDGLWVDSPDYSDPRTRETLKREALELIARYRDVRGVLMFALGNESNYGLAWKGFEIEDLPVGEQQQERARHLYSLFAETMAAARTIAPNHPITIVNGDIQYLDLIDEYGEGWDMLGVNAYRGKDFTQMWRDVRQGPDVAVVLFEFGSDAFNAREFREDQQAQANYLKSQWADIYRNAYGRGYGNAIGGFVFEWRDEWWKYRVEDETNLDRHDPTASWENGGYTFDHVEGRNNMNEEWFGINRLGDIDGSGVYVAEARAAYEVLKAVWTLDPYTLQAQELDTRMASIDVKGIMARIDERDVALGRRARPAGLTFKGGELRFDALTTGFDNESPVAGEAKRRDDVGQMTFLDFDFQASSRLSGDFTVNMITEATDSNFEFRYGDRVNEGDSAVEIYDFQANYTGEKVDVNAFYHVPRYHWGYKGDFFGLLRETTDMDGPNGQDIWNAKAPFGVELIGKQGLSGLTVVAGPEIYWGANPKALVKYQFGDQQQYTFMHAQDFDEASSASGAPSDTVSRKTRQTTLQAKIDLDARTTLEVGAIVSGTEKIGEQYDYLDKGQRVVDDVRFHDTLGFKTRLSFDLLDAARSYVTFHYAGLVANGGEPLREEDTQLPYTEVGNKLEAEWGVKFSYGDFTLYPRVLHRENLLDANPSIAPVITGTSLMPGVEPRNTDDDPFAVLSNREASAGEIYFTYDPTPGTPFYDWDNDQREDAALAYNVGLTASRFGKATDAHLFYLPAAGSNVPFGAGLPSADVFLLKSKLVMNPSPVVRTILKAELARQQPTKVPVESGGEPVKSTDYFSLEGKLVLGREHILSAKYKKDGWGSYDFQRDFNVKYPHQLELKYVRLLDKKYNEKTSTQFGVKGLYRTLDEYSPEYMNGSNDYMYELQAYFSYRF